MSADQTHEHSRATGLLGVRELFLGRPREYAHSALRWASAPLFKLAWIAFLINVLSGYHSTVAFVVFLVLGLTSFAAEGINAVLLRRRKFAAR